MQQATKKCEHCGMFISVRGKGESWAEMLRVLDFRFAVHNLKHYADKTDVYSQMKEKLKVKNEDRA